MSNATRMNSLLQKLILTNEQAEVCIKTRVSYVANASKQAKYITQIDQKMIQYIHNLELMDRDFEVWAVHIIFVLSVHINAYSSAFKP